MSPEVAVGAVILVSLTLYTLSGIADFGGGLWDLLAWGPRAARQRQLIARALAPIWEADHVWLILVLVLLFVAFPTAFAAISISQHLPLTLMLVGIVLRGSAFAFCHYGRQREPWGRIFAGSSILTPVTLGMALGALGSGRVRVDVITGQVCSDFFRSWWAPFPLAVGLLTLAVGAWLSAVYLTLEAGEEGDLAEDFRRRALGAGLALPVVAWLTLLLARRGAPYLYQGLLQQPWSVGLQLLVGIAGLGALTALGLRRYWDARALAVIQVALMALGWGAAQYPYLVVPDLTLFVRAAPASVLRALLGVLGLGALVLFPGFFYLYRVFKAGPAEGVIEPHPEGPDKAGEDPP